MKNYSEIVQQLISSQSAIGCNMSLQLHFLHSHLDFFFPGNMGVVSDEHGESFYQDISQIEKKCSGEWSSNILVDCCLSLILVTLTGEYKKQKKTKGVCNNLFWGQGTVCRDTVHYMAVNVVIKNQYITFLLQRQFSNLFSSLNFGGRQRNLFITFGFININLRQST